MEYTYYIYIGFVVVLCGFSWIFQMKRKKASHAAANEKAENFLKTNPLAARIILQTKSDNYQTGGMAAISVDGEEPVYEIEGRLWKLLVTPGTHVLKVKYYYEKSTMLSKRRTQVTVGPSSLEVTVEENKVYELSYSINEKVFKFDEYQPQ